MVYDDGPLVSIIITVFNTENFVQECIESVCSQTYKQIEIIIVDDGSTDNSPLICDKYQNQYSFIKVIHKKNEGVSVARNVGMDNATGKYITFIDSDDLIEKNYCESFVKCAEDNNADIVICDYKSFGRDKMLSSSFTKDLVDIQEYKKELILRTLFREFGTHINNSVVSAGATWGKFYNLEFIRRINVRFIPGLVRAQDTVFWLNVLIKSDKIVHLKENLYSYRLNNLSVCGGSRYFADSKITFGKLLDEYKIFIEHYRLGEDYLSAYYCRVIEVLFWHWKHNYFNTKNGRNFIERVNGFYDLMKKEPYRGALENVDISQLSRRQRGLVITYKYHMSRPYIILYRLMEVLRRREK